MLAVSTQTATDPVLLSFEQTVPRSLVHKRALENVLLTEVRSYADDRFICAGRVPTAHRFFNDAGRTPQRDILFYTELGRQASLAVSHAFLNVGLDDVFIFEQSEAAITEAAARMALRSPADAVVTEIRIKETSRRKNGSVSRVVAEHLMSIGDQEVFSGVGAWTVQSAALFQRLRRMSGVALSEATGHAFETADDSGRLDPTRGGNIVISRPRFADATPGFVASLIVDDQNPYFFDHPCDHVPGMLLLEACAQLAIAAASQTTGVSAARSAITAYGVNFAQFVERGVETTLAARVSTADPNAGSLAPAVVDITISQQDVVSGTTSMKVALTL